MRIAGKILREESVEFVDLGMLYKLDIKLDSDLHRRVPLSAEKSGMSLNGWIARTLKKAFPADGTSRSDRPSVLVMETRSNAPGQDRSCRNDRKDRKGKPARAESASDSRSAAIHLSAIPVYNRGQSEEAE